MKNTKPGMSIVFSFRNRDISRVINSIDSLHNQSDKDFEIIFIDYGSDLVISKELRLVLGKYENCRYYYSDTRGMPWNRSHALNTGIRLAKNEYIFTSDIDIIFRNDFVKIFKEQVTRELAIFFCVGYLKEEVELKDNYRTKEYDKSKSYALGLLGVHKKHLFDINGYDEFYSFWGMEDNDLEFRLKQIGRETYFNDEMILLYHQYHPPAHRSHDVIPNGWKVFQTDYYYHSSDISIRNTQNEWGKLYIEKDRAALTLFYNNLIKFKSLNCRSDFLNHYLCKFAYDHSQKELKLSVEDLTSGVHLKSRLGRFIKFATKQLSLLPFNISSAYRDQFSTGYDHRDAFIYFIKNHDGIVSDYFYEVSGNRLFLTIIKK